MASIETLDDLLVSELRELYDGEQRLTKAIPKLVESSSHIELSDALNKHLDETREHVLRLERAFEELDEDIEGDTSAGIKGLINEGDDHAGDSSEGSVRDAAIIGAAQRVEHYEIAAYGTAIAHARVLGYDSVVDILQLTLNDEKAANQALTKVAEGVVNRDARAGVNDVGPRTSA